MSRYGILTASLLALTIAASAGLMIVQQQSAEAHCQVPCGIYDDAARITQLKEDTVTIAKAIDHIVKLSGQHDATAFNQSARWVSTKEQHASHIITVVAEYFLTQKVKPVPPGVEGYEAYLTKLADHHAVMSAAMKTKQSADPATVTKLKGTLERLARHYK